MNLLLVCCFSTTQQITLADVRLGNSLVKLGRAHCKVATIQEAYALTFQDTFISSLQQFGEEVKEYEAQRKKLESKR